MLTDMIQLVKVQLWDTCLRVHRLLLDGSKRDGDCGVITLSDCPFQQRDVCYGCFIYGQYEQVTEC